jgi:hypothetical protein
MRIPLGMQASSGGKKPELIVWDSDNVVNGHMLIMGMSGAGKTHNLRKIINKMRTETPRDKPFRVHIFDIHGDIDIDGSSSVLFSEQTEYGLNPLIVDNDPHFGGVRKRIQGVIKTLNRTSRQLGDKQEACLRNLMHDLYDHFGFDPANPETWRVDPNIPAEPSIVNGKILLDIPYNEKDEAKAIAEKSLTFVRPPLAPAPGAWAIDIEKYTGAITNWMPLLTQRRHPTMADLLAIANKTLRQIFFGQNHEAVIALEVFQKASRSYRNKVTQATRKGETIINDEALLADLKKHGDRAIEAYSEYVESVKGGKEMEELLRFSSVDVLKSCVERLENLLAIGIFKGKTPPFDEKTHIWRYDLKPLGKDEQKLFVLFRLEELFLKAVQRGETDYIADIFVVDEASNFFDDDESNILNTIAKEARKFGVSLICASQAPTHFSDDFVSSVGTKIVLGIDEMFWPSSSRKLNLPTGSLEWVKPTQSMLLQMKQKGIPKNNWNHVVFNPNHI